MFDEQEPSAEQLEKDVLVAYLEPDAAKAPSDEWSLVGRATVSNAELLMQFDPNGCLTPKSAAWTRTTTALI